MINLHDYLPISVAKTAAQIYADKVLADVEVPPMKGFK